MTKWPGFAAGLCIIALGTLLLLVGGLNREPATGFPQDDLRSTPSLPTEPASPRQPSRQVLPPADDPVLKWLRHSLLGETPVDVLFANPLLPDSQRRGQLLFKVFLYGNSPGRNGPMSSPEQGAMVLQSDGTVLESCEWEVEESTPSRTVGYISVTTRRAYPRPTSRQRAWIRLVLKDQRGGAAVFEWRLASLAPRDAFW